MVPIMLGILSLYENIVSNFYFFEVGYNLALIFSGTIAVADWGFDLQIIEPLKPWNRYDPHVVKQHLHE